MPTGKVKYFNTVRGFGFTSRDDGGEDVFVHITNVIDEEIDDLPRGTSISFDIGESTRKPGTYEAKNVKVIS